MLQEHPHRRYTTPPPSPAPPPPQETRLHAAGRFAVTQLRALRWALTATGMVEVEMVHDYLLGIETGLRHALGEGPGLVHVEPGGRQR